MVGTADAETGVFEDESGCGFEELKGGEVRGDDFGGSLVEEVVDESGEEVVVLGCEGLGFPAVLDGVDTLVGVVEIGLVASLAKGWIIRSFN